MIHNKTINSVGEKTDDFATSSNIEGGLNTTSNSQSLDNQEGNSTTTQQVSKPTIKKYIIYFLVYSLIFWSLYFIYQYKTNQEFKQKFVKWYLATFHKKTPSITIPSEFKVDFTTYKLPFKTSGGAHAMDYFKFTQAELKHYNGKDPSLPIFLAIKGRVYDVSEGSSYYGIDGGYHFFAGRDGTRSFVTGCFDEEKEECTSVQSKYSDFDEGQMQSIEDWVKFYDDHEKYKFIGIVTDIKNQ